MINVKKTLIIGIICILLISGAGLETGAKKSKGPVEPVETFQIQGCIVDLPPDPVTMSVFYILDYSQFIVTLSDVPTGYDITNGIYNGWCVDLGTYIEEYKNIPVMLYSSYCPPGHLMDPDWDMINYILNNKADGSDWNDVHSALLYFVNVGSNTKDPTSLGQAMIDDAEDYGEGFTPGPGEFIAIICDSHIEGQYPYQIIIIEIQVPSEVCTRTQGYWKNHPDDWPIEEITIGDVDYTKAEAIEILKTPVKKDMTIAMFYQLVAAKLNVEMGADPSCIDDVIADADDWMIEYGPAGSGVPAESEAWDIGEPIKDELDDYNNGKLCAPHCDD